MTIHIEITKSYKKGRYRYRIGDVEGSIESNLSTKTEVLKVIKDEIDNLKEGLRSEVKK